MEAAVHPDAGAVGQFGGELGFGWGLGAGGGVWAFLVRELGSV